MVRAPSFAGVILAAGTSSRMGCDKALLALPSQCNTEAAGNEFTKDTFLSAAICSLSLSTDFVFVVAGKNEIALGPIVYANGASLVVNPDPDRGQFSSLQVGLREVLNRGRDTAMITLVDRPAASTATVLTLRQAFEAADDDTWAVIPECAGRHGHPYIAGRELIEAFLRAPTTANAREILHEYRSHVRYVSVEDAAIAMNINTPEDYAALQTKSS